jgi:hypothetical protein
MTLNKLKYVFLTLIAIACGVEGSPTDISPAPLCDYEQLESLDTGIVYNLDKGYDIACIESVWICHNIGSKLHNQICTPECMVPGDNKTYCWLKECTPERR